jgi:hypothetical protein
MKDGKRAKFRRNRNPSRLLPPNSVKRKAALKRDYSVKVQPAKVLSAKELRLIEYYSLGYSATKASVMAGYAENHHGSMVSRILADPVAVQYYDYLMKQYEQKHYATKEQIVRELMTRVPESSTKDLVAISNTLAKLHGWNLEKDTETKIEINIGWGEDPFITARKENTIDAEFTVVETPEDDLESTDEH